MRSASSWLGSSIEAPSGSSVTSASSMLLLIHLSDNRLIMLRASLLRSRPLGPRGDGFGPKKLVQAVAFPGFRVIPDKGQSRFPGGTGRFRRVERTFKPVRLPEPRGNL